MSYKKWIYKYKYLKEEFDEISNLKLDYLTDFENMFKFRDENPTPIVKKAIDDLNNPKIKSQKKPNTKNLYKKLSKKLHPDKGGNTDDFIELNELYEEGDLLGMITKAEENNVNTEEYKEEQVELEFEYSCLNLEKKINELKDTLAWKWGSADIKDKPKLILEFEAMYGLILKENV